MCNIYLTRFLDISVIVLRNSKIDWRVLLNEYHSTLNCLRSETVYSWSEMVAIVDKVRRYVCGYSNYEDRNILIHHEMICNEVLKSCLPSNLESCTSCSVVSERKEISTVAITSMYRDFKPTLCIDHMYLRKNLLSISWSL